MYIPTIIHRENYGPNQKSTQIYRYGICMFDTKEDAVTDSNINVNDP